MGGGGGVRGGARSSSLPLRLRRFVGKSDSVVQLNTSNGGARALPGWHSAAQEILRHTARVKTEK